MKIIDGYPTIPLSKLHGTPIGTANFKEPVFKMGIPQNTSIQVTVTLWPSKIINEKNKEVLHAVQFGQMNIIRYVPIKDLYDIKYNKKV